MGNCDVVAKRQTMSTHMNQAWWERMVAEGNGFTLPWLDLDRAEVQAYAAGTLDYTPRPINQVFPASLLKDIQGKDVLCMASGGGQQSAVFGLLGANVTVVDITEGQLAGDQQAAAHYGYAVRTIQADMSDLSMLEADSFDLVYQAPSMAYIPDVMKVYAGVARVLRSGGLYRADAHNPVAQFIDTDSWDGVGYRITVPYAVKARQRTEDEPVMEYRHELSEVFNGLIACGFVIEHVVESPIDLYEAETPQPGSWLHPELYAPGIFAIVARKQ
jgi:SAM-dependent methyltransferase